MSAPSNLPTPPRRTEVAAGAGARPNRGTALRTLRYPAMAVELPRLIAASAATLPELQDPSFASAFDRYANARVVLLGEASHGTSEFYRARAAITRRFVVAHGFTIITAEADWPDAASFDRYIRDRPKPAHAEPPFRRFPTWMWRNTDIEALVEDLRTINLAREPNERAGFYGLDLYNLSASMRAVIDYLERIDPEAARLARRRYGCLTPWEKEPQLYGRLANARGYAQCEPGVVKMLSELCAKQLEYTAKDGDSFLDASANARLVKNAEAYYRVMYQGAAESWNLRDTHMFETLCQILDAKGENAKAIVWAHNSHIGDARHTAMGWEREELNLGQLCRERFGDDAVLIGFGTHEGSVACASDWDEPMAVKAVNPSLRNSVERLAHASGIDRFLLDLRNASAELTMHLSKPRLERFIGVIYRPETERWSHYVECSLAQQFDAYVWFEQTSAVTPLPTQVKHAVPETFPFGV